jgi:hypothetical protein
MVLWTPAIKLKIAMISHTISRIFFPVVIFLFCFRIFREFNCSLTVDQFPFAEILV